jgi:MFS family permease
MYFIYALIGGFGAGSAAIPYLRVAGAWFNKNRGLAFGLTISGGALGYAYTPILVQYMIDHYGWRSGYYALSTVVLCVALPLAYFMIRNKPTDLNFLPDGENKLQIEKYSDEDKAPDLHWVNLLKMKIFYQLFVIFLFITFCLYGFMANLVPMLHDRGMDSNTAVSVAVTLATSMLIARVAVGFLLDRYFAPRVAVVCVTFSIIGIALFAGGATGTVAFVAAILVGISLGAEFDILAYLITRYFGLHNFGMVYGILFSSFLIGVSIGPKSFGEVFDAQGSYINILIASCVMLFITVIMLSRLPKYDLVIKNNDVNS